MDSSQSDLQPCRSLNQTTIMTSPNIIRTKKRKPICTRNLVRILTRIFFSGTSDSLTLFNLLCCVSTKSTFDLVISFLIKIFGVSLTWDQIVLKSNYIITWLLRLSRGNESLSVFQFFKSSLVYFDETLVLK